MRLTTILRKEGSGWKMAHQHASIGVPNEQVDAFRGFEEATARA
jgi:ketosteroid isomerase-like protein